MDIWATSNPGDIWATSYHTKFEIKPKLKNTLMAFTDSATTLPPSNEKQIVIYGKLSTYFDGPLTLKPHIWLYYPWLI